MAKVIITLSDIENNRINVKVEWVPEIVSDELPTSAQTQAIQWIASLLENAELNPIIKKVVVS